MPGRDGTGPMGAGAMTGRGLGLCRPNTTRYGTGLGLGLGLGLGCRRGFGRGFGLNQTSAISQKELLEEQKNALQNQIEVIENQHENL